MKTSRLEDIAVGGRRPSWREIQELAKAMPGSWIPIGGLTSLPSWDELTNEERERLRTWAGVVFRKQEDQENETEEAEAP